MNLYLKSMFTNEAKSIRNIWSNFRWGSEAELPNRVPNPNSIVVFSVMLQESMRVKGCETGNSKSVMHMQKKRREKNSRIYWSESPSSAWECSDGCNLRCSCRICIECICLRHRSQADPCQSHKGPYWSQVHPRSPMKWSWQTHHDFLGWYVPSSEGKNQFNPEFEFQKLQQKWSSTKAVSPTTQIGSYELYLDCCHW